MEIGSLRLRRGPRGLRAFGLIAAVWSAASCHAPIDTARIAPPKGTLGDDFFGVFCDRVGSSALTEDTSGASFQRVCHYDEQGHYADKVDESLLPMPSGDKQQEARRLSLAKMDAMVRRRGELIRALNTAFPDVDIADPTRSGEKIRLHDAFLDFSQKIVPLYDSNPYDKKGDPLLPSSTRSMARLFDALLQSGPSRDALARTWGRQGYRPFQVGLGAVRPALSYPGLRDFAKASLNALSPNGAPIPELTQLLAVGKQEMLSIKPTLPRPVPLKIDAATLQPNRPRSGLELAAAIFLHQDDAFAATSDAPKRLIAARDKRGFVLTTPQGPFVDKDGDGLADIDASGRFIDGMGKPLAVAPPFAIPGVTAAPADALGIPEGVGPFYQYLDTSRTAIGATTRHFAPLVDATIVGAGPDAWKNEHETLMYAVAGATVLLGDREPAQYDFATDKVAIDGSCPTCTSFKRFKTEDSPLPDLAHAIGQILADPESDAILESLGDLMENHASTVARLLGATLRIREIALAHDALAAQGKEAFASMPYETPIWDEFAKLVGEMTGKHPGLLARVLEATAKPDLVTKHGASNHIGETLATDLLNRDEYDYDHKDINAPSVNLTLGAPDVSDPRSPVDQTQPKTGKNRSILQRTLQMIHDANSGPACNKNDAKVKVNLANLSLSWPLVGDGYKKCELFRFENLASFYLNSTLAPDHPKRTKLALNDSVLNALMSALGVVVSPDKLFEDSSGITGLTTHPTPVGLNRLVFFGASSTLYKNLLDLDPFIGVGLVNEKTNSFISSMIEPISASWCPVDPADPNKTLECPTSDGTLREADAHTLFALEKLGFYEYLTPIVTAFANESCAPDLSSCDVNDVSGEKMLVEMIEIFYRHWSGKDHGPECEKAGNAKKYCSEAGLSTYEPIAAEAFKGDIIPALHAFAEVATKLSKVTVKRGPKAGQVLTGAEVVEKLTRILFDPAYAASVNMVDRKGNKATKWVNGTDQPQITVFTLFADALHKIDLRWEQACVGKSGADLDACKADVELRKGQWQRARSQLVDEFATVDGEGPGAQFHDRALPRLLSTSLRVIREQLNAQCPDRETGGACTWARKDFGEKLSSSMGGPLFASLVDVMEQLRKDDSARRETEKLLAYLLSTKSGEGQQAMLASLSDAIQLLSDEDNIVPILNVVAGAANPEGDKDGAGVAATGLNVLKAITSDDFDRYHVMDQVLPNLVTPIDGGKGLSPIEIIMDTISEVNRIDAASADPLTSDDYRSIMSTMKGFMADTTRGLEQFYTIIKNRPHE